MTTVDRAEIFLYIAMHSEAYIAILLFLISFTLFGAEVIELQIPTNAPNNRKAIFQVRVPSGYDDNRIEKYRVLIIFGGRNTSGKEDASGRMGWGQWCDDNDIFLLCPGFQNDEYWEPKGWAGRALSNAMVELVKRYNICTQKVLFYGYSAGAQASNLFPAWMPNCTRAWVSHACGYFHEPIPVMRGVPGLVTCGDADLGRYLISRDFVYKARQAGYSIIFKTYANHEHDVPIESLELARAFLLYYHLQCRGDLQTKRTGRVRMPIPQFIGDDNEGVFYPAGTHKAKMIPLEDRVPLPNRKVAEAWGQEGE